MLKFSPETHFLAIVSATWVLGGLKGQQPANLRRSICKIPRYAVKSEDLTCLVGHGERRTLNVQALSLWFSQPFFFVDDTFLP